MTITPDDGLVLATMTGFGYITSWHLDGNILSIAQDPACPQIYGNASKLVGYAIEPDGWLDEITARPFPTTAPRVWLDSDAIGAWKYARSGPSPPSPRRAACPPPRAGCT
jgi:hypothetical protein